MLHRFTQPVVVDGQAFHRENKIYHILFFLCCHRLLTLSTVCSPFCLPDPGFKVRRELEKSGLQVQFGSDKVVTSTPASDHTFSSATHPQLTGVSIPSD